MSAISIDVHSVPESVRGELELDLYDMCDDEPVSIESSLLFVSFKFGLICGCPYGFLTLNFISLFLITEERREVILVCAMASKILFLCVNIVVNVIFSHL